MVMKRWSKDRGREGSDSADEVLYRNFWSTSTVTATDRRCGNQRYNEAKSSNSSASSSVKTRLGEKIRHLQRPKIK